MFETDFPHPTSLFGDEVHERIKTGLDHCGAAIRHKILWGNGQKLYKIDEPTAKDEEKLAGRGLNEDFRAMATKRLARGMRRLWCPPLTHYRAPGPSGARALRAQVH